MASPRTLLGPLTTTWSPPPICSYFMALCDTCTTVWQAQTCNPISNAHDFTDCWPPRSGDQVTVDPGVMMGWGFYSPGILCPAGYSTAAVTTSGASSWPGGVSLEYQMVSGETVAACCPTGFSISWIEASSTYAQTCVLTATTSSFITVQCNSGTFVHFSTVGVPATVSNNVLSSYVVFAPLIQLNYQSSDVPASAGTTTTTPDSSSTSSSSSSSSSPNSSPTTSIVTQTSSGQTKTFMSTFTPSATPPPSGTSSSGLSNAAKIGIGVGAGIGTVLLLAIVFLVWRQRRKASGGDVDPVLPPAYEPKKRGRAGAELGGEEVRELDGRPIYTELPTRLPSQRNARSGAVFRRSDQNWIVSPIDGTFSSADGTFDHSEAPVYELEGDSTPRSTFEDRRGGLS